MERAKSKRWRKNREYTLRMYIKYAQVKEKKQDRNSNPVADDSMIDKTSVCEMLSISEATLNTIKRERKICYVMLYGKCYYLKSRMEKLRDDYLRFKRERIIGN